MKRGSLNGHPPQPAVFVCWLVGLIRSCLLSVVHKIRREIASSALVKQGDGS